jgi:hypothetical protein
VLGAKKAVEARAELASTKSRTPWPWPRAALAIILLSLLLWAGVAAIALLAWY